MLCIYNRDANCSTGTKTTSGRSVLIGSSEATWNTLLRNGPMLIYEQNVEGEPRFVYYGETDAGRLLAVVLTERDNRIRVVTAYKLDAGQRKDYFARRLRGE